MVIVRKVKTVIDLIENRPETITGVLFGKLTKTGVFNRLSDETYQKLQYKMYLWKKLDLNNPKTFNEKLQWLKLYNRNPLFTQMVDKFEVRKIIETKIGKEYLIPLIGVYDSVEEIQTDLLPNKFVLKCTHDSGSVCICRDKGSFDFDKAKSILHSHQERNLFWWAREWPYKNVKPRIIAEEFIKDESADNLPVYKFLCFNGKPEIIQVIQNDKQDDETIDYYDTNWDLLKMRQDYPNSKTLLPRPKKLKEMLDLAAKLAEGMPFIRVDLYLANNRIYFSEFTFFSDAGIARFYPNDWDEKLGKMIDLSLASNTCFRGEK